MPKRAAPGHRETIEEELGVELLQALAVLCRRRGIRPDLWQTQPDLEQVFTTHAATVLSDRLQNEGMTMEQALVTAAIRLGVEPSTIAARQVRHRKYALKLAA